MQRIATHFEGLVAAGACDMVDALAWRARERPQASALVLLDGGEKAQPPMTYASLHAAAAEAANGLARRAAPGDRVVVAFPAGPDFVVALFACWMAGLVAVPAPVPRGARGWARTAAIVADCAAAGLLTTPDAAGAAVGVRTLTLTELADASPIAPRPRDPEAPALLQYTSGSTGAPKGVVLPHRAIWHNQGVIRTCFDHAEGVVLVGWLPNFHDMGLIGNLLQPLYAGGLSVMMAPSAFLQRPMRWLRAVSDWRAHTSGAPNFAYELCVRAATEETCAGLDLSAWRVAFNGAEPIRPATLRAFAERFAPCGFRPEAFMACYGLAESTLMVTGSRIGRAPRVVAAAGGEHVACGDAVGGTSVRIVDPDGAPLADGAVGEIVVAGPSVCAGYWGRDAEGLIDVDGAPHRCTGDLGAVIDGDLVIVGRLKDAIIVHGRTLQPTDIETAAEAAGAAAGVVRAVACGVAGPLSEDVLLFAELDRAALRRLDAEALVGTLRAAGAGAVEVTVAGVVLLKPGALPLTSSGKRRRGVTRDLFLAGALKGVAHADAGALRLADALAARAASG